MKQPTTARPVWCLSGRHLIAAAPFIYRRDREPNFTRGCKMDFWFDGGISDSTPPPPQNIQPVDVIRTWTLEHHWQKKRCGTLSCCSSHWNKVFSCIIAWRFSWIKTEWNVKCCFFKVFFWRYKKKKRAGTMANIALKTLFILLSA